MTTLINKDKPLRERIMLGLVVLFFLFIVQVLATILSLIAVFQFFATLITGQTNNKLQSFSESLAEYLRQVTLFVAYVDECRPWPFSKWPEADSIDNANESVVEIVEDVEDIEDKAEVNLEDDDNTKATKENE